MGIGNPPFIIVFLRNSYIKFSFTAVYQRSYNKSSGNEAVVLVIFIYSKGFKVIMIHNIIKTGGY